MTGQRNEGEVTESLQELDTDGSDDLFPVRSKAPRVHKPAAQELEGGPDDLFWGRSSSRTDKPRPKPPQDDHGSSRES